jgi:hypothetical protein
MQRFNRIFPAVIGWGLLVAVAILTLILLSWKWALILVASVLVVILLFYRLPWMGFGSHPIKTTETKEFDDGGTNLTKRTVTEETQAHRTLWDWIGLVTLSAVLAVVAFVYTREQQAQQEYIQDQKAKDASLQAYIDGMAVLLLDENLPTSEEDAVVRDVARARTLVALLAVGPERKRNVIRFLYESNLINNPNRIVDLTEANLEDADLTNSPLSGIDLSGTNLSDGPDPDSQGALLMGADLQDARVDGADLSYANLKGATGITNEELQQQAALLKGTIMPEEESKHP